MNNVTFKVKSVTRTEDSVVVRLDPQKADANAVVKLGPASQLTATITDKALFDLYAPGQVVSFPFANPAAS